MIPGAATIATRWRAILRWLLALLAVAYVLAEAKPPRTATGPDATGRSDLVVAELETTRVSPGGAVVVRVEDVATSQDMADSVEALVAGQPAELLYQRGGQYVFQIPSGLGPGSATVQLRRGEWRSPIYKLEIREVKRRKFVRNLVGGLALVVLGLRLLSSGLRRYVGSALRRQLARLTQSHPLSFGLGVVLGGLMQATTSAAGMLVGLLNARMVGFLAAFAMLLGAQFGAGLSGAVLPLAAGREALLLVALGVAWTMLAADRRQRGSAELVLGLGLLFHGLQLVRVGANTVVDDPEVLAYLRHLDPSTFPGLLACGLAGALLCALLQGPGPVFVLVSGLAQSSGLLSLNQCMAILSGTMFGSALGTAAVASPFGRKGVRLARWHLLFAALASVAALALLPLWGGIAAFVLASDPDAIAYGKKILYPNVAVHLTVAFIVSQAVLLVAGLPLALIIDKRRRAKPSLRPGGQDAWMGVHEGGGLHRAIRAQQAALEGCRRLSGVGDRSDASEAEHHLRRSRDDLEAVLRAEPVAPAENTSAGSTAEHNAAEHNAAEHNAAEHNTVPARSSDEVGLAALQLQVALEGVLRVCDRGVERDITLSTEDQAVVSSLAELICQGFSDIEDALDSHRIDITAARAREIRTNCVESDHRRKLATQVVLPGAKERALFVSELIGAYENVGNQLFRLAESAGDDPDDY